MTTPEVRELVLRRDGMCIVAMLAAARGISHQCHGKWGLENPHRSNDLNQLTIDHVNLVPGGIRGKRAVCPVHKIDDEHVSCAICARVNVNGPEAPLTWRDVRNFERNHLRSYYPEIFE